MPIVLAYHGCDVPTAQALLGGSAFAPSNQKYDWLGSGAYFWEWDFVRAWEWAKERRTGQPSVIGAAIELGNCLDLTTRRGVEAVRRAHVSYVKLQAATLNPLPENKPAPKGRSLDLALRYLDRAVIDHLHELTRQVSAKSGGRVNEFDTVRALFPEGDPAYPSAGFFEKTHVQIAVRNLDFIRGVFRLPNKDLEELSEPDLYVDRYH